MEKGRRGVVASLPGVKQKAFVDILEILPEELQGRLCAQNLYDQEWPEVARALLNRGLAMLLKKRPHHGHAQWSLRSSLRHSDPGSLYGFGGPCASGVRATNHSVIEEPQDFVYQTSLQHVVVLKAEEMLLSGENLVPSFLLLKLPECWPQYLTLEKPVRCSDVGKPNERWLWLG